MQNKNPMNPVPLVVRTICTPLTFKLAIKVAALSKKAETCAKFLRVIGCLKPLPVGVLEFRMSKSWSIIRTNDTVP